MTRLRFTRRTEWDIEEIGDFIARDNPARAVTFIAELTERCEQLVEHPTAAPIRPEF